MQLYNTLTKKVQDFQPLTAPGVTLYTCGPTVYDYTHLGHIRKYVNDDLLKRSLNYLGYKVKHVMNITDVGHLTSDEDEGEDKLEKGAAKTGKTVWEVARFYTDFFEKTMRLVNIIPPDITAPATKHIDLMIDLISVLQQKGFVYMTDEAVYFEVSRFPSYGQLSGQNLRDKKIRARPEIRFDPGKKSPFDFALWFKRVGRFADHSMHWDSPWGDGFPGWHIECSAMSMKYLGETIDIHTGGVDHIPVHHENEIAQSEAATGQQFVRFFVHHQFVQVDGQKMSKSLGNFFTVNDVKQQGIDPLSLRLLFMQTHYRQIINFTWNSAKAANESLKNLRALTAAFRTQTERTALSQEKLKQLDDYRAAFMQAINQDLQFPRAVSIMWAMTKSNLPSTDKLDLLLEFDRVLGLDLQNVITETIPPAILELANKRQAARAENNFQTSDDLRQKIEAAGYVIEDTPSGFKVAKK
ncbi:cysteine--tRNA ligase [Candidatus Roizmanbacteria bacterium]|nr:cysteine--tRNA ligase [Candidatus Roizmanbacteria bacterium]